VQWLSRAKAARTVKDPILGRLIGDFQRR